MDHLIIPMSRQTRRAMGYTLAFLLILHGFRFVSLGFSHDALAFAAPSDFVWKVSLGRYMQPLYWKLRGYIAAPYLVGLMTWLWLGISAVLVLRMTQVTGRLATLLACGVMASSQAIISANTGFIHETDTFMLALLLAVGAAYLCLYTRFVWLAASPVLLAASAGLYQSFIQAYVALVMIVALLDLLRGAGAGAVALRCTKCALALAVGMALYLGGYELALAVTGIERSASHNGLMHMAAYGDATLLQILVQTYVQPFGYLRSLYESRNAALVRLAQVCALLWALGATAVAMVKRRMRPLETAAVLAIVLLLPLGVNCIFLIYRGGYHDLMLYSYCLVNVYAIAVTEQALSLPWPERPGTAIVRRGAAVLPLLLMLILFDKTVFANQLYLKKELEIDSTLSVMTRVLDRLEQTEGYAAGETPVVFVGSLNASQINVDKPAFAYMKRFNGSEENYATTFSDTYWMYVRDVLGYPMAQAQDAERIARQEAVRAMPAFPQKGSVAMVQGVAVIKFSD